MGVHCRFGHLPHIFRPVAPSVHLRPGSLRDGRNVLGETALFHGPVDHA